MSTPPPPRCSSGRGLALPLAAALFATGCGDRGAEPPDRPSRNAVRNVVLFTIDTLRADQLGVYGNPQSPTPAADALAAESLLFEHAYCQATITNPSLTSILTGLLPIQTGVHDQAQGFARGLISVPTVLQAEGLATGSFLANMCKLQDVPGTVFHDGWDERFCGMLDDPQNYSDQYLWDQAVVDGALDWIARQDGPWFAWVHLMDPHAEHRPPPHLWDYAADPPREKFEQYAYYNRYEELREMPPEEVKARLWELYSAQVRGSDEQLARMLAGLRARDDWDRTALIFSADHGEELFETWVRYDHGFSMTDGVFHVPLLVRAPGLAPGRVAGPVEALQIGPTLLDLFDLEAPYPLAGPSLLDPEPSRGFALSYGGAITTSVRGSKYRYWLRHQPEAPTREEAAWRLEAPWFLNQRSLATYEQGSRQPVWLDPEAAEHRIQALKLERAIRDRHAAAPKGEGLRIDDPGLQAKLAELGYADPLETGAQE
jgi:arylsulfatase A-like enzyme